MAESTRYVGVRRPRIDARDKVLGATRYGGDLGMPGLLHARIVPSVYAHAMIRGIDGRDACCGHARKDCAAAKEL